VPGSGQEPALDDAMTNASCDILVAHNRLRTIGRVRIANTHPFCRDGWAFAHAGTIEDPEFLRRRCSPRRLRQLEGETDSELLFAYLLGRFEVAGKGRYEIDVAIGCCVEELAAGSPGGGFTFLLSDGMALYAYRRGQPLFVLDRRTAEPGAHELPNGGATLIASAPLTDEAWLPVAEGDLVCITREGRLSTRKLGNTLAPVASSGPELPFTD
jgi:glutamine amidotransferase